MRMIIFSRGKHHLKPWRWFINYSDVPHYGRYLVFGPVVIELKKYRGRSLA
jgi:hypothetical protein